MLGQLRNIFFLSLHKMGQEDFNVIWEQFCYILRQKAKKKEQ